MTKLAAVPSCLGGKEARINSVTALRYRANYLVEVRILPHQQKSPTPQGVGLFVFYGLYVA